MTAIKSSDDADSDFARQRIKKKLPKFLITFAKKAQPTSPAFSTNARSNYKKIKYLDVVSAKSKHAKIIASGVYYFGLKL